MTGRFRFLNELSNSCPTIDRVRRGYPLTQFPYQVRRRYNLGEYAKHGIENFYCYLFIYCFT